MSVGALIILSSLLSVKKIRNECIVSRASHLAHRCEPRWRSEVERLGEMAKRGVTVESGVVGFGLNYACAQLLSWRKIPA